MEARKRPCGSAEGPARLRSCASIACLKRASDQCPQLTCSMLPTRARTIFRRNRSAVMLNFHSPSSWVQRAVATLHMVVPWSLPALQKLAKSEVSSSRRAEASSLAKSSSAVYW